jgi:hypothetical protein
MALPTGVYLYHVTVEEWVSELMGDLIVAAAERDPWQLPSYEAAHGEEFITTFLRPPRDF